MAIRESAQQKRLWNCASTVFELRGEDHCYTGDIKLDGSVVFHHGGVEIDVTLDSVLEEIVKWVGENPQELVLILPSNAVYESTDSWNDDGGYTNLYYSTMYRSFSKYGIKYSNCQQVYEYTVGDTMALAQLSTGGYVLALDAQD